MESSFLVKILFFCLISQSNTLSAMKPEQSDYFEDASGYPASDDYFVAQPVARSKAAIWGKYFFEALERGPIELVKKLLEFHADFGQTYNLSPIVDLCDLYGRTALIIAVMSGSAAKVKLVLDSVSVFALNDYINKSDQGDWSAVVYADHLKFVDILAELKSREKFSSACINLRIKHGLLSVLDARGIVRKQLSPRSVQVLETIPEAEKESEESDEA
jgi:hypothetical protein